MCTPVIQGYGLTETCAASFIGVPDDVVRQSAFAVVGITVISRVRFGLTATNPVLALRSTCYCQHSVDMMCPV